MYQATHSLCFAAVQRWFRKYCRLFRGQQRRLQCEGHVAQHLEQAATATPVDLWAVTCRGGGEGGDVIPK
jgi:hypothetical protein